MSVHKPIEAVHKNSDSVRGGKLIDHLCGWRINNDSTPLNLQRRCSFKYYLLIQYALQRSNDTSPIQR